MKFTFTIVVLLLVAIVAIYLSVAAIHPHPPLLLTTEEARQARFGLIIDVRSPKDREYLGYYPNSISLSLGTLPQQIGKLTSKATSILVYSNGDSDAQKAAELLYSMGFHNVHYINTTYQRLMPGQ